MGESGSALDVDDSGFSKEILESNIPALVDFWASWCRPCLVVAPVIEELAKEYKGRIKVAKLSVEENFQTPGRYGVRGIPTLILFKNGRVFDQIVGAVSKEKLREILERGLGST